MRNYFCCYFRFSLQFLAIPPLDYSLYDEEEKDELGASLFSPSSGSPLRHLRGLVVVGMRSFKVGWFY